MPTLKPCLGYGDQQCTRLAEGPRCDEHQHAYDLDRSRRRGSPRQRGYDAEYLANRRTLRATAPPVCVLCGRAIDMGLPGTNPMGWTAHHVIAQARGGTGALANLRPAHNVCNNRANDRSE